VDLFNTLSKKVLRLHSASTKVLIFFSNKTRFNFPVEFFVNVYYISMLQDSHHKSWSSSLKFCCWFKWRRSRVPLLRLPRSNHRHGRGGHHALTSRWPCRRHAAKRRLLNLQNTQIIDIHVDRSTYT